MARKTMLACLLWLALGSSVEVPKRGAEPTVILFVDHSAIPAVATVPDDDAMIGWPPPAPYDNVVKDLGAAAAASVEACQAACVAYRNADVSPVSGWTRCESFTFIAADASAPVRCVAVVDAEEWDWTLAPARGAVAGRVAWPARACAHDADCSFNGACVVTSASAAVGDGNDAAAAAATCACDAAWTGDRCQTLALEPATRGAGLRMVDPADGSNVSSWGGAALLDADADPPRWHMWASEMAAGCGIEARGVFFREEGAAHPDNLERASVPLENSQQWDGRKHPADDDDARRGARTRGSCTRRPTTA